MLTYRVQLTWCSHHLQQSVHSTCLSQRRNCGGVCRERQTYGYHLKVQSSTNIVKIHTFGHNLVQRVQRFDLLVHLTLLDLRH